MSINVKKLALNSDTAKTIAKRVMKDRNMYVTGTLNPPVSSNYKVKVDDRHMININYDDKSLEVMHMAKIGDRWEPSVTNKVFGSVDFVKQRFAEILDELGLSKKISD